MMMIIVSFENLPFTAGSSKLAEFNDISMAEKLQEQIDKIYMEKKKKKFKIR